MLRYSYKTSNSSSEAIKWLSEKFPKLYARHRARYSGHYPDDFMRLYQDATRDLEREAVVR